MYKRLKLGLIFTASDDWIGGTYYILNLINALKTLPQHKQPFITILSKNEADLNIAQNTGYAYLGYRNPYSSKRNLVEKVVDKIYKIVFKRYVIDKRISKKNIDVLFPANNDWVYKKIRNKLFWFPDFQHVVYPNFFSEEEIKNRNLLVKEIANSNQNLILSSCTVKSDWDALLLNKKCRVHVIPFAVTHPRIDDLNLNEILDEFKIGGSYFMISNQFWIHKNHMIVLKAALKMKQENASVQFIFTGKEDDYRHPGYFTIIKDFIGTNNLETHVKMLGLIDRSKQLKLMQQAIAIIQPSLFEGWSTVIEDAKLLGKLVIASNIDVHKEQLGDSGIYFDPFSENDLVNKINDNLYFEQTKSVHYKKNVEDFGCCFLNILEKAIAK